MIHDNCLGHSKWDENETNLRKIKCSDLQYFFYSVSLHAVWHINKYAAYK